MDIGTEQHSAFRTLAWFALVFAVLALGLAGSSYAQEVATISGTAVDKTGAVVPKVTVTAIDSANGLRRESTTGQDGTFVLGSLPPGTYSISAKAQGFSSVLIKDVELHARDQRGLTLTMEVGAVSQTVEVTAEAALINNESGVVATVVDRKFIENMPLNGRTFQSLISLTPGVVITGGNGGAGQFSVNGQRSDANYFMIDGVSANAGSGNGLGTQGASGAGSGVQPSSNGGYNNLVSVDALQEFKIETSTFMPEHGRLPGGQVVMVTRSGNNRFHGTAFEYIRNTVLDANNWFNNHAVPSIAKPPERQNDFGGVFGGPIWKNRLFFFFSYEGQRLALPANAPAANVPSLCARGTGPCPTGFHPAVAAVLPFVNSYPIPNSQCVTGTANCDPYVGTFATAFANINNLDATSLRLDWTATKKMTLFARGNDAPSFGQQRNVSNAAGYSLTSFPLKTLTLGQTYVVKSNITSDLRFNYSYARSTNRSFLDNFGGATPLDPSYVFTTPGFTAATSIFNWNGFNISGVGLSPLGTTFNKQYNVIETLSWVHGRHQMKFGVDFRKIHPVSRQGAGFGQTYSYTLTTLSWINNQPASYTTTFGPLKDFFYYNTGFYGQDTWKATARLTLNFGLRWDINPPPGSDVQPLFAMTTQFDPTNLLTAHVAPQGTPVYATQWNGFAPRFGVAYQLSKSPNWGRVVRGGYGLFFDTGGIAAMAALLPLANKTTTNPNPPTFVFPVPAALAVPPVPVLTPPWTSSISTVNPHFRMPYTHQFNVAVEQSLGSMQTVSVTYAGALGKLLTRREQFPNGTGGNPEFLQGIQLVGNGSWSNYHSLQVQFTRRLSHGLQAMAGYTWAHSLDTFSSQSGGNNNSIPINLEPASDYYGNSDFDIRHQFQTAITYNAPSPSHNPVVEAVMGHWSVDSRFGIRTALPIDLIDGNALIAQGQPFLPGTTNTNPSGVGVGSRAVLAAGAGTTIPFFLSDPTAPGGKKVNPAAFILMPANALVSGQGTSTLAPNGIIGRNYLRMFGWNQLDLSVRREFPIHESLKFQFRADFFNIMNHPSFFCGGNCLSRRQTAFGVATGTLNNSLGGAAIVPAGQSFLFQIGGPRSVQFSGKFVF